MNALATLEGLENGTDIGIQTSGNVVQKWKVRDGGLEKDGVRLDEWMFGGYLRENRVYLADFSPPQAGEWFTSSDTRSWLYLVLEMEDGAAHCAQFRHGAFYQFQDRHDLVDRFQRVEAPEWGIPIVRDLCTRLWVKHREAIRTREMRDNIYGVAENLRYITSYAQRATEAIGRINR